MSWNGVKKQVNKANIEDIKSWCEEMGIKRYTITFKGEIDVDDNVDLRYKDLKELPYKFGRVSGFFVIENNSKLTSLKNCPNRVEGYFSCYKCPQLDSLEGCPNFVEGNFYCRECKCRFVKEDVQSLCKVKYNIFN